MNKKVNFTHLEKNALLIKSHGIIVRVKKKDKSVELGSTNYTFSYSFKGDMFNTPIDPSKLISLSAKMAKKIKKKDQILIALDRGGTAIGLAISMVTKIPICIAFSYFTKPPKDWIWWKEKGAGKSLAIPLLPKNSHVILVDDEINTGLTYVDALEALEKKSIHVDQILVVFEIARKKLGRTVIQSRFKNVKIDSLYIIPEPVFDDLLQDYSFTY